MKRRTGLALVVGAGMLAACGGDEGRGGLTAEEERQLDEAAKMLDDNMVDVSPDSLIANEAQIEAMEANDTGLGESPPGNTQ